MSEQDKDPKQPDSSLPEDSQEESSKESPQADSESHSGQGEESASEERDTDIGDPGDSGDGGDGGDDGEDGDEEKGGRDEMTLTQHLEELRKRIFRAFIAVVIGFVGCYPFAKRIFEALMEPMTKVLDKGSFIYTYPPEAFFTYIKVSLVAGVFLTSPYIFFQVWKFIAPGLYSHERKVLIPVAMLSGIFFTAGAMFGYFVVFPFGFEFFASFATENITFMPKLSEYLGFSLKLLFAFGLVFEMPLFVLFLAKMGLVTAQGMRKYRKYAILCSFILSAILTPPDIFTQTLMAGPLIILYEVSIIVAKVFGKKPKPKPQEDEDEEGGEEGEKGEADDS